MPIVDEINTKKEAKSFFPICNKCANKLKDLSCKAFQTIPDSILSGENNHSKIIEGQKGEFLFEEVK